MTKVYNAPETYPKDTDDIKIFLGGSIEMGKAEPWQDRLAEELSEENDVMVLNPRRPDWDSTWKQDPTPGTKFREQVDWELAAQDDADIIVYYFDPKTTSPITLLELGMYAVMHDGISKFVVVCCPKEYYRYGNVKIVCEKYGVNFVETYNELVVAIKGEQ